jgi:hypothetical protein
MAFDEKISALLEQLSELLKTKQSTDNEGYTRPDPTSEFVFTGHSDAATESPTPAYERQPLIPPEAPSISESILGEPVKRQKPKDPAPPSLPRCDLPSLWRQAPDPTPPTREPTPEERMEAVRREAMADLAREG